MSKIVLTLQNVAKKYRQGKTTIEILKDINLTIRQGEIVAIIGSSGSGKSTLLHIAGLLNSADRGKVEIISSAISPNNLDLIRRLHIGFVYQHHHLLKDFTALENVAMPKLIAGSDYQLALQEAEKLLTDLGLATKKNNMPGELSGGQQQRVAIARALINSPSVVLADEPTGNLDSIAAGEVFELFLNLTKQKNTGMVMVTHNHQLAYKMHRVYELREGMLYIVN